VIIGIDPGQAGGIAFIFDNGNAEAHKMPETERDIYDLLEPSFEGQFVFLESVHSMPGQGVSSTFKFGKGYGFLRGIICALKYPLHDVTPQAWQKALGCMSKGDKNTTKQKAQQLFPHLRITHATADALLIAEYGRRFIFTQGE
jgi:Holliday junction resolvasome RuvABC endonuclease subunit